MSDTLSNLYKTVQARKENPAEGSYTSYLFEKGTDKILKKCGEECAEVIIAAKNGDSDELVNEVSDLLYHLTVLLAHMNVDEAAVSAELNKRSQKIGNLKQMRDTDTQT